MAKSRRLAVPGGRSVVSAPTVILTAMDAGAAHHLVHLTGMLRESETLDVQVYLGPVALEIFNRANVPASRFEGLPANPGAASEREREILVAAAERLFGMHRPSLVVGGLSNSGNGPDEAMAAVARRHRGGCKVVTVLDDRGPLFSLDGGHADHLLATSRAIYTWARRVAGPEVHLTGSLKHHALSRLPVDRIRRDSRRALGLPVGTRLVTFIAQSDAMIGHNERFRDLVDVLDVKRASLPPFELLIRVHPGAPEAGLWCYDEAISRGLPARCDQDGDMVDILTASDALFSCSSTSMTDYIWLSLGGSELNAVPVYLLGGDAIREWLMDLQGTWQPDLVSRGLAYAAGEGDNLADLVVRSVRGELAAPQSDKSVLHEVADPFVETAAVMAEILTTVTYPSSSVARSVNRKP